MRIQKILKEYHMEHSKIYTLLNDSTASMFVTRKWIEVNFLSNGQYSVNKNIRFKTPMVISDLRNYSDADIVLKGIMTLIIFEIVNTRNN